MLTDYFLNGQGHGEVAEALTVNSLDPNLMRPFYDKQGRPCVNMQVGYDQQKQQPIIKSRRIADLRHAGYELPIANATTLRKDEWIMFDNVVIKAARQRLRAYSDLASRNRFGGFNAMGKMILEHETMSDPGEAVVDMDGMTPARSDQPQFQLEGLPLPITHSDFYISKRRLQVSRNTGTPLDTTMAEAAGRRVGETIEKTLIGTETGVTYGVAANYNNSPRVWGYTSHPDRITDTGNTAPTGSNGPTILSEWLAARDSLYDARFYGPFMVYTSNDWDQYLDNLFSTTEPSAGTLRSRLLQIEGVQGIRRLDYLTDTFTTIWVQMTPDVARAVDGLAIMTVQWESHGGMRINFKVMAIQVPQLRSDYNGNMGLLHSTM